MKDLSMRTAHRVRLSMVGDLSLLDPDARDRLKDWPIAVGKILDAINAAISDKGGAKDLPGNQIDHNTLCKIGFHYENVEGEFDYVRSGIGAQPGTYRRYAIKAGPCKCWGGEGMPIRQAPCYDGQLVRLNLVQTLFVAARNKNQLPGDLTNNVFGRTERR